MKFSTKAVHAGVHPDAQTGAVMTPIYQTSTYAQRSPGEHKGFEYSRTQNPTRFALQNSIAELENGKHGLCFSSGMGAIDAILKMLSPGDEVISTDDLYGGSFRIFTKVFEKYGIKFHFIPMKDAGNIEGYISDKTKLIWIETPTNPMMNIVDIEEIAKIGHAHGVMVGVDNTFASPALQQPFNYGVDIIMHSVTKYLGGHSDVVMGALVVNDDTLAEKLAFHQNSSGAVPGPQDCFLVLRGIKTLALRMKQHCLNGEMIAKFLSDHKEVDHVYWPGLKSHPNHEIAVAQMSGFGGMISFTVKGNKEKAFRILENVRLFTLAESLGGVESLCNHPATMTHASIPVENRLKLGITDDLIRLSVGIEDADDLIADLDQALKA